MIAAISAPYRVYSKSYCLTLDPNGYKIYATLFGGHFKMNPIAKFVKENRKLAGLTQEEFAIRSGLGLRFVRELEQGKETVRMDKVNQALAMFNRQAVPGPKEHEGE